MNAMIKKLLQGQAVEWQTLGEVAKKISSGGTPKTGIPEYYNNGEIPWLRTQEVNFNDIYETGVKITEQGVKNSSAKWIPANCVIMAMYGATVGRVGINKIPMTTNQACANIEVNEEIAEYRYVYYCLANQYEYIKSLGTGSQTNINAQIVRNLKIPIPPLSVQSQIVQILDTFTELTAELSMRQKQYQYYRDFLLSEHELAKVGFEWKTLGEIAEKISSGGTPKTDVMEYWENGTIPWMSSGEVNLGTIFQTEKFISKLGLENSSAKFVPKNSVVIALAGQGKTRGKVARTRIDLTTNQSLASLIFDENKINSDYIYYYLTGQYNNLRQISSGNGTRGGLNLSMISGFQIPIPPLSVQSQIVAILDTFDTLVNSICEGLPKEIKLRQTQYEYYREQLLNFKATI
ncbi:Type I restriction-modification system, specificity subunit S [Moraxella catarrhalis]|uniref:restriction endonuclease subunit S n=1 Tax=Moraxella catarrhalis TaxID=480 RepID=UPI0007E48B1E|nr:restriction endonuclease subunit S [Moraxella catarrhalis]OAV19995.1 Type I restriction-modification system, specificity subunit S [Moraxella catarrhalis]